MIRAIVIGLLLVLLFAVVLAPASLIRRFVPADSGIELLEPAGSLWDGAAELYLAGQSAGRLDWDWRPSALLTGAVGYDLELTGPGHALTGAVGFRLGAADATVNGRAGADLLNRWLAPYDIHIGGTLEFQEAHVRIAYDFRESGAGSASGSLLWSGGPVRYVLSGRANAGTLPPLVAYLGEGLETVVIPQDGQTPLLQAEILPNGFLRIGVTKLLTRLMDNPWPGPQPDHEVVLEVEEQVF